MKKFFYFTLSSSTLFLFFLLFFPGFLNIFFHYFFIPSDSFSTFFFNFSMETLTLLFFFMVLLVSSLVLIFGEFYMEHYNNKKFFILSISFMISMLLLCSSGGFINLMLGWDGLGITSLFLIMFYPNKNTMFNSMLTMFFNRLGDVILLYIISVFVYKFYFNFVLTYNWDFPLLILILVCSFTKSAQFPLSSWLPAAMSAPTPISAMVHSSTLVTAGVYLMFKFYDFSFNSSLTLLLFFISIFTFIIGGSLANLDMDLKKIVAFSTMSQISMIMVFISISLIKEGQLHMLYHASFKTFLFCSCGFLFCLNFSDQFLKIFRSFNSSLILFSLMFLSIYSMSGLIFSLSFFSKDLVLETINTGFSSGTFIVFLGGSGLTLFYCCKLLGSAFSFVGNSFIDSNKSLNMTFLYFFGFLMLFLMILSSSFMYLESFPMMDFLSITLVLLFFLMTFLILLNKTPFLFSSLPMEVFFMKYWTVKYLSSSVSPKGLSFFINDQFIFKSNIFFKHDFNFGLFLANMPLYLIFFLGVTMFF